MGFWGKIKEKVHSIKNAIANGTKEFVSNVWGESQAKKILIKQNNYILK